MCVYSILFDFAHNFKIKSLSMYDSKSNSIQKYNDIYIINIMNITINKQFVEFV